MRWALVVAAACSSAAPTVVQTPIARASEHPKLVVLLVLDQWPAWAFDGKRPALHAGGFDRLLAEGEWHRGRHPSAATLTAPGHALLGTGQPTAVTGILANSWYHRDLDKMLEAAEQDDGSIGPQWLRVRGLGEEVVEKGSAKAYSVSLKSRAAILMLGHAGTPIWYDPAKVAFVTTTNLGWLDDYGKAHPIEPRLHQPWTPLPDLPGRDDRPGEPGEKGFGGTFPHDPQKTKSPAEALDAMPLGNEVVLEIALAAIDGARLGQRSTDYLAISLSAHDYVGHGWGQESWEMWDLEHRLDASLKDFLAALDAKVGAGNWAMIVTSDHGGMPTPNAGDITYEQIVAAANRAAVAELGDGQWIAAAKYPTLWLTKAALATPAKDLAPAIKKIVFALRSFPGLERVDRTAALAGDCDKRKGDAVAICLALDPERSGEIAFFPRPGWVLHDADEPMAAGHGSIHDYDRLVPLIVLPPGRTAHAPLSHRDDTVVEMTTVTATLAGWLGVPAPATLPP